MNKKAKDYWKSLTSEKKQALADRCETENGHLMKKRHLSVIFNGQPVSYKVAKLIASKTGGKLKPSDIRKPPY